MDFWIMLWKIVFLAGVGAFAVMAVWVAIFGARDIKKMLANLAEEHETGETQPKQEDE